MKQYLDLLRHVRTAGVWSKTRQGVDAVHDFAHRMEFSLSQSDDGTFPNFPLMTTKKIHFKSIITELIWIIRGETNTKYLKDRGVTIWDEWANPQGELGPVYGNQWRHWRKVGGGEVDQLQVLVERIKKDPKDRRLIVNAWNVGELEKMALPPCHMFFQCYVADGKLSLQMYQRSCDLFLGVPFNIASYALLTILLAKITGLKPGRFIHVLGDAHIFENHFAQVDLQLTREPRALPTLILKKDVHSIADIEALEYTDFEIVGYDPHSGIKAPIAI